MHQRWPLHAGHSKGGDTVITYAGTYDDIPKVVNVSGRFFLDKGSAHPGTCRLLHCIPRWMSSATRVLQGLAVAGCHVFVWLLRLRVSAYMDLTHAVQASLQDLEQTFLTG